MRIVYLGNTERGAVCLEALAAARRDVALVVALPDESQPAWSRNVAQVARGLGIPVFQPVDVNAPESIERLRAAAPDVMVLCGYNQLLKGPARAAAKLRCINLHAGPLPLYRGAAPLNWMLINGETRGGISILDVDDGIDTGDILAQAHFDIGPNDTYRDLVARTLELYPPMLVDTLARLESGTLRPIRQSREDGSFYTRRRPDDGKIDWRTMSAAAVHNLVRALAAPAPGAFAATIGGGRIGIETTIACSREYRGVPGRVAARLPEGVVVICADRGLSVVACRLPDGSVVPARDAMPPTGADLA